MSKTIDYKAAMLELVDLLYLDVDGRKTFYNEDKERDAETIERVAAVVRRTFEFWREGRRGRLEVHQHPSRKTSVLAYVSGGVLQGASADSAGVALEVFDVDDKSAEGKSDKAIEREFKKLKREYYPHAIY